MIEETKILPSNNGIVIPTITNNQQHPKIVTHEELYSYIKSLMKRVGVFKDSEIEFAEGIASRIDRQPGLEQVGPIVQTCTEYLNKVDALAKEGKTMSPWDMMQHQTVMRKAWEYIKLTAYRQKRVLLGAAARKQHPKYSVPNLNGLLSTQTIRCDISTVYNLGFAESRTWLTKKALENQAVTHLLLVDDDLLVPVDIVERLLEPELPIVSGVYLKKNITNESIVTTVGEGGQWGFKNVLINPSREKVDPIHVGCTGLGMILIETNIFRQIPEDQWYRFIFETNPDGSRGRVLVGEDSALINLLMSKGIRSYVMPDVIGIHCDFKDNGRMYGPDWIIDRETGTMKNEWKSKYTCFPSDLDVRELAATDNDNVFSNSSTWTT